MKHTIEVRLETPAGYYVIERITRRIWAEQIGNFNPIFCRYRGKRCLVKSDAGDTSDPFRRDATYQATFHIVLDLPLQVKI